MSTGGGGGRYHEHIEDIQCIRGVSSVHRRMLSTLEGCHDSCGGDSDSCVGKKVHQGVFSIQDIPQMYS